MSSTRTNRKPLNGTNRTVSASQRVHDYLTDLRRTLKPGETLRIPPVRQLSRDLKVSKATIYHAFKELTASGVLSTAVGRGSFLKGVDDRITVGLNWSTSVSQPFTRTAAITHALFHTSFESGKRMELLPIPQEAFNNERHVKYLYDIADQVDAVIFGSSISEFRNDRDAIISHYESRGKPIILLDAPALNATRNFVAPDIFGTTRQIANAWVLAGRQRIAFMMRDSVNATVTTLHALIGLKSGIALGGNPEQRVEHIICDAVSEEAGYHGMLQYLKTHPKPPDALYCFGDLMAWGAISALEEKGISIPDEISVIGGTGFGANLPTFGKFSAGNLTRVRYSFETIAHELIRMTKARIQKKGTNMPGIFVPGTIIGGITTRSVENERFPMREPSLSSHQGIE